MENISGIIGESVILILSALIFMRLTIQKNNSRALYVIMYVSAIAVSVLFFVLTCFYNVSETIAFVISAVLIGVIFLIFSKHKDARFFVSFCMVNTLIFILNFLTETIGFAFGVKTGIIAYIVVICLMIVFCIKGKKCFEKYCEILESVNEYWVIMALSAILSYFLVVFAKEFPISLFERQEYIFVYVLVLMVVISFYAEFISSLYHKKKLCDLNVEFQKVEEWREIAYIDSLTKVGNRMSYIERINELEITANDDSNIYAIMIDINNFKKINDNFGHHIGDDILKNASAFLLEVFSDEEYEVFRIGGDEFAVIATGVSQKNIEDRLAKLENPENKNELGCTFSYGYSFVDMEEKNAMATAFICADGDMYKMKRSKKAER